MFGSNFKGFVQSLITPFTLEGTIDKEGLRGNINFLLESGEVEALTCLTAAGECESLTKQEAEEIMSIVSETVKGRVPVLTNTGKATTEQTIELSRTAVEKGIDGLLLLNPLFLRPTHEGTYGHYKEVSEAVDLPIIIYDGGLYRTGFEFTPGLIQRLSKLRNVIGFKDMSRDLQKFSNIIESTSSDFHVFQGWEQLLLPSLSIGGKGIISLAGHVITKEIAALLHAQRDGKLERAREVHYKIQPFLRILYDAPTPVCLKYMLDLMGLHGGPVRKPLLPLDEKQKENVRKVMESMGLAKST